jgi:DNA (cytosine-5)-methyltransferase 1
MNTLLTAGSLFSGIGSAELAFERCGIPTLWASEIDPQAVRVHARHFPRTYQLGDICDVGKHNAAPVDIIVGGSPCQDLSIAGNRAGLAGERSGLFYEFIRVIDELKPTFVLWENVPGALTSHAGRDFASILGAFHDIGARDIAWRVLNAQYFGLAQRRKRLFVVVDFRGNRAGEILFEPQSAHGYRPPRKDAGTDIAFTLTGSNQRNNASNNETFIGVKAAVQNTGLPRIAKTITTEQGRGYDAHRQDYIPVIAGTIRANGSGLQYASTNIPGDYLVPEKAFSLRVKSGLSGGLNVQNSTLIPQKAGTLAGSGAASARPAGQKNELDFLIPQSYRVRRLMPVECERLQGFADSWTRWNDSNHELADSPRYRMLGNSMAVPVIEWIARRMVKAAQS